MDLNHLEQRIHSELEEQKYPGRPWLPTGQKINGQNLYDVAIIGGGQSGLGVAFGLKQEKITNVIICDQNPTDHAGPWRNFARMPQLRTPKYLSGLEQGFPCLSFKSWAEAAHGKELYDQWAFIPTSIWADYLKWFQEVLSLQVQNETRIAHIQWDQELNCFVLPFMAPGKEGQIYAKTVVFATGIDGGGGWHTPEAIKTNLPKELYFHTEEAIPFENFRGKKIGILGSAASAFDNAIIAKQHGADVSVFCRRDSIPNRNPYRWAEFVGFLKHHHSLDDASKWRFIHKFIAMGQLPPAATLATAEKLGIPVHCGSPWEEVSFADKSIKVRTPKQSFNFDYVVTATGLRTDLSQRQELSRMHPHIALWEDRYTPPTGQGNPDLLRHPYLGEHLEFLEKTPGDAAYLNKAFCFSFATLMSGGFSGGGISGLKYGLQRVVGGISRRLYLDHSEHFYQSLEEYQETEF